MPAPGNILLLHWVGWWLPAGPDHGRDCLFHTEKEALAWARKEVVEFRPEAWRCVALDTSPPARKTIPCATCQRTAWVEVDPAVRPGLYERFRGESACRCRRDLAPG